MAGNLKNAVSVYQSLKKEFNKKSPDIEKCAQSLKLLKIALTGLSFLPSDRGQPPLQEFVLARDVLEIGAQLSIIQKDIPAFSRYMSQLKSYYLDYDNIPASSYQQQLLGLNLLCLLSQNRVAEFHTELERLPAKEVHNKVLLAKGNVPAESYKYFIDILMITVRNEIASCLEKAYADIICSVAARTLSIGAGDMNAYASERGWQIAGGRLQFRGADAENEEQGVPSVQLANMAITYAREMEQIV